MSTVNSVIIFDWDDTLFPNCYYNEQGYTLEHNFAREEIFSKLEEVVISLVKKALILSQVYIITASTPTWVWETSLRFYPELCKYLLCIPVISVNEVAKQEPHNNHLWKVNAFFQFTHYKNILSIGDGIAEKIALLSLPIEQKKHIEMIEDPPAELLLTEIDLLNKCIETLYEYPGSLNLSLQKNGSGIYQPATEISEEK